jgi:cbb3-type cytochrome oxidase subunit 3
MLVGISEAIRLLSTHLIYIKYLFILLKYSLYTKSLKDIKDNKKMSIKINEDNNKKESIYSGKDNEERFNE